VNRLLLTASGLCALYAVLALAYYWDLSRLLIKAVTAKSPYTYAEIDPAHLKVVVEPLLGIIDPEKTQMAIRRAVFGAGRLPVFAPTQVRANLQNPTESCPDSDDYRPLVCMAPEYVDWKNLGGIDQLSVPVIVDEQLKVNGKSDSISYIPPFAHFRPKKGNGRLILLHHGYGGIYHDQHRHIERLLELGYSVMAFNMYRYGFNQPSLSMPHGILPAIANPLRVFIGPVVGAVGYALKQHGYKSVDMIGLSAGAWVTALSAAVDSRIRASYPVAGVLPVYLRGKKERPAPQLYGPLLAAASYPDMFVLGAWGEGRRQMQIFNRYDRCCYGNARGKLYEKSVQQTLTKLGDSAEKFAVLIDETHPRHKISAFAMDAILADLDRLNAADRGKNP